MHKKLLVIALSTATLILWPLNLYLKNTLPDFVNYIIPAILILISYFLYTKEQKYYLIPLIFIGIYEKKLAILPLIFCGFEIITNFRKEAFSFFVIALSIFFWQFTSYKGQTVFNRDYEGEQLLIRNIHLYPNVLTARTFQNKPTLYLSKVSQNFFRITDLNNYFFAGHPAPTDKPTQELYKYYWPLIVFLILGIYHFNSIENKQFLLKLIITTILSLSLLNNYDRSDFVLWFPISLVIIHGIKKIFR